VKWYNIDNKYLAFTIFINFHYCPNNKRSASSCPNNDSSWSRVEHAMRDNNTPVFSVRKSTIQLFWVRFYLEIRSGKIQKNINKILLIYLISFDIANKKYMQLIAKLKLFFRLYKSMHISSRIVFILQFFKTFTKRVLIISLDFSAIHFPNPHFKSRMTHVLVTLITLHYTFCITHVTLWGNQTPTCRYLQFYL